MKWVLIIWFVEATSGSGETARALTALDIEFNTQNACQTAGQQIKAAAEHGRKENIEDVSFVCVMKG